MKKIGIGIILLGALIIVALLLGFHSGKASKGEKDSTLLINEAAFKVDTVLVQAYEQPRIMERTIIETIGKDTLWVSDNEGRDSRKFIAAYGYFHLLSRISYTHRPIEEKLLTSVIPKGYCLELKCIRFQDINYSYLSLESFTLKKR